MAKETLLVDVLDGILRLTRIMDSLPFVVDGGTAIVPDGDIVETYLLCDGEEGNVLFLHFELWAFDLVQVELLFLFTGCAPLSDFSEVIDCIGLVIDDF
jgi:hypothetical protein